MIPAIDLSKSLWSVWWATATVATIAVATTSCATNRTPVESARPDADDDQKPLHRVVDGGGDPSHGRDLYVRYCQTCHGAEGRGDGPAAESMETKPRDFTSGHFKFASTIAGLPPTDGDLFRTIAQGVPGTAMPAWGNRLDDDEIWALVAYVKTFSTKFQTPIPKSQITTFPEEPPDDAASRKAGRKLYMSRCVECHGSKGRGNGPGATGLKDYKGRAITPRNFTSDPFKSGGRSRDIYRTIANGLEGTPMAPHGPALEGKQIWHLVHYVESLREPPSVL
ncbi:MAG: cytochrome c, partial [Bradymonadaceae bacterium]